MSLELRMIYPNFEDFACDRNTADLRLSCVVSETQCNGDGRGRSKSTGGSSVLAPRVCTKGSCGIVRQGSNYQDATESAAH
jgi:hypothetical protein